MSHPGSDFDHLPLRAAGRANEAAHRPGRCGRAAWALLLVLCAVGCQNGGGVTSVLDKNRTEGLTQVAEWRSRAERAGAQIAADDDAARSRYEDAASAVEGWVDATKAEVDTVAAQTVGSVDLSANAVDADVRKRVEAFFSAAGVRRPRSTFTEVVGFIQAALAAERKASAEALKSQLEALKWPPLDELQP